LTRNDYLICVAPMMDRCDSYSTSIACEAACAQRVHAANWLRHSAVSGTQCPPEERKIFAVPLPSRAQFLNVIESVFSGMARAIIHNSDYSTVEAAQAAIVRYIDDRNSAFRENPRKAGRSIWRKERVPSEFRETNNCKDVRYR
jgi:hypothetical protein